MDARALLVGLPEMRWDAAYSFVEIDESMIADGAAAEWGSSFAK